MDNRRYMLSVVMTMAFFLLWLQVAPRLFPGLFPKAKPKPVANQVENELIEDGEAEIADKKPNAAELNPADPKADTPPAEEIQPVAPIEEIKLSTFNSKVVLLGEEGYQGGYLLQAQINTVGAAIDWVQLTDPRYTNLDRQEQLKVVGNEIQVNAEDRVPRTLETSILQFDEQLKKHDLSLAEVDWEITKSTPSSVTFRYPSPDGKLEAIKTYRLSTVDVTKADEETAGYLMDMDFVIKNVSDKKVETAYTLQGPVGLPLEDIDNTRLFREIKIGTLENDNNPASVTSINLTAAELVKQIEKSDEDHPIDAWREELQYAGVDVQFFAALLLPKEQLTENYFEVTIPEVIEKTKKPEHSDISLKLQSTKLVIDAGKEVRHSFNAFFGPKRTKLLDPLLASQVVALGWFAAVSKAMLWVLGFFHTTLGVPYAFAIILLTVVVRGMMFPISKKQAIEGEKMKVLAPKLKEIQEKHKDKPEEFAKAYREFQKKHDYHPLVGCLPALLQLPIFYGLYSCLFQAVDLRLSQFLWIDNLAAPDALFHFGMKLPFVGWDTFNLLPLLTVGLFIAQQKLFTPPATSPDQEATYKMMNYMMIFMGFLFYRVPAGLCLYFIASSVWGISERLLLKKTALAQTTKSDGETYVVQKPIKDAIAVEPQKPSFFGKLVQAADQAKNANDVQNTVKQFGKKNQKKKPKR